MFWISEQSVKIADVSDIRRWYSAIGNDSVPKTYDEAGSRTIINAGNYSAFSETWARIVKEYNYYLNNNMLGIV